MKFFTYCRRSSDREDRQTLSIEAQSRELKNLIKNDPDIEIVDTLIESHSAYKPGRPVFNEMLERIDMGEAEGILVWQANRLARNSLDGGRLIYMMDEGKLTEIRTMSKVYTGSGNDKFFLNIEFGMAKKSSDDTSDYMKRDAKSKLIKGEWVGMAPIGYLNIDKQGKIAGKFYDHEKQTLLLNLGRPLRRIEKDPIIAPLIRKFFEEYLKGDKSLHDMAAIMNNMGVQSPRFKGKYTCSMVDRILKNIFFTGSMAYEGEVYDGIHEGIISRREFDWIQERITQRMRPPLKSQQFIYGNQLIKCGECGCSVVGVRKTKKSGKEYEYYGCSKRKGECGQRPIKPDDIDNQVEEHIKKIHIDTRVWQLCQKLLKLHAGDQILQQTKLRNKWEKDLNQITGKLEKLLDLHLSGDVLKEAYSEKKNSLMKERLLLKEKLDDAHYSVDDHIKRIEAFFETAYYAYSIFEGDDLQKKKVLIRDIGWNLKLLDGNLSWEYKKPFNFLAERETAVETVGTPLSRVFTNKNTSAIAEVSLWRTGRDSNPRSSP